MTEAFILIDVQAGFTAPVWGRRNNPNFEARWAEALAGARAADLPVWHVRHLSLDPGSPLFGGKPGSAFAAGAEPRRGEPAFEKHVNSAFIGTDLEARLRSAGITKLTLAPKVAGTLARAV